MPVAALCPSCSAPISETAILALAPTCTKCGVVLTEIGGTLGVTSAYGLGDPSLTRRRVEADLAVCVEYQTKYRGMKEACRQQLEWGAEKYATLPQSPEMLELEDVPSLWKGLGIGLVAAAIWPFALIIIGIIALVVLGIFFFICSIFTGHMVPVGHYVDSCANFLVWVGWFVCIFTGPFLHFKAKSANGDRPDENARRQKVYEDAKEAAMRDGQRKKEAEDHRLRVQIRELEGLAKTVSEKAADIRQILTTL